MWLVGSPEIPPVTRHRVFDKMGLPPTRRSRNYLTTSEDPTRIPDGVNKAQPKFKTWHMKGLDPFIDFYVKFLNFSSEANYRYGELPDELKDKISFDLRAQVTSR
jgi:hypothetical protein